MATLGGVEMHVTSESPSFSVDVLTHPVEKGENVADHVKKNSATFSIEGIMIGDNAEQDKQKLIEAMEKGKGLFYEGATKMTNVLIQSFQLDYSKQIKNGFAFSMGLTEYRTVSAKSTTPNAAKKVSNLGTKQVAKTTNTTTKTMTIRKGDTFWALAKANNTTVAAIKKLNPGVDPLKLQIGSKVKVK